MSHSTLFALALAAVFAGCNDAADGPETETVSETVPETVSDTVPETVTETLSETVPEATAPATGLVFVPDPGLRIDNASNAKAGIDANGKVYLYYQANPGGQRLATADDGLTFSAGVHTTTFAYHPARLALADGTWRRYLLNPQAMTFSSEASTDGLTFTPEAGIRYSPAPADNAELGVYDTFLDAAGGVVLLYLGDLHGKNNTRRAYATDGLAFAFQAGNVLGDDAAGGGSNSYVDISSVLIGGGHRRLFAMKGGMAIHSFLADADGTAFTLEPGNRVARTDFSEFAATGLFDPTVVRLPDGTFRMYVTAQIDGRQAIVSAHAQ